MEYTVLERFLKYVTIDTQSDPNSDTSPTTEKQKDLGRVLVQELHSMGIPDAELDEFGYVYATIPANTTKPNVPTICFCSHMDTAPDCSGYNVKPQVHKKYDGSPILFPDDEQLRLEFKDHPELANQLGNDIVTASGLTLLGADNKAGIAEIMAAAHILINEPNLFKHGKIRILFTPDEEVGKGVDNVDIKKLDAQFGYTMDGDSRGRLEDETFSADLVTIDIQGVSVHPGYAKGIMENAIKIGTAFLEALPKDYLTPETTENKQGFVHPVSFEGKLEHAKLMFIIRDFKTELLQKNETFMEHTLKEVMKKFPNSTYNFKVTEQYRNMKEILDQNPQVCAYAKEAIQRAGMTPRLGSIRGGTDGSRLSFMSLPCPNIFAGEHLIHGKKEWVSVQDMEKAVDTILHLAAIWEEHA
jgi:tripeptide aminopeptidase